MALLGVQKENLPLEILQREWQKFLLVRLVNKGKSTVFMYVMIWQSYIFKIHSLCHMHVTTVYLLVQRNFELLYLSVQSFQVKSRSQLVPQICPDVLETVIITISGCTCTFAVNYSYWPFCTHSLHILWGLQLALVKFPLKLYNHHHTLGGLMKV